ncbi:uncharacterized protein PG998_007877 [Apiospora kogelbergensis]|uniref:uncharacterized protein n=1 Tax=Apiospora kogelbergensis TaxID=1337665 RepID=UPI00312D5A5F
MPPSHLALSALAKHDENTTSNNSNNNNNILLMPIDKPAEPTMRCIRSLWTPINSPVRPQKFAVKLLTRRQLFRSNSFARSHAPPRNDGARMGGKRKRPVAVEVDGRPQTTHGPNTIYLALGARLARSQSDCRAMGGSGAKGGAGGRDLATPTTTSYNLAQ